MKDHPRLPLMTFAQRVEADNREFRRTHPASDSELRRMRSACTPCYVAYQPIAKLYKHLLFCTICQKRAQEI